MMQCELEGKMKNQMEAGIEPRPYALNPDDCVGLVLGL